MRDPVLVRMKRRLDRLALEQLREVAAVLREDLDRAKAAQARAEDDAERWYGEATMFRKAVEDSEFTTHRFVALTKDGGLIVVKHAAQR